MKALHLLTRILAIFMVRSNVQAWTTSPPSSSSSATTSRASNAAITHSFPIREFQPAWFATNPHIQTILGVFFRQELRKWPPSLTDSSPRTSSSSSLTQFTLDERTRVETPDGDFFDIDWKYCMDGDNSSLNHNDQANTPIVLICHGLQSNSESGLAKDMARAFLSTGFDVACINFRSCSGQVNRTPRAYHVGFYDDLLQTITTIGQQSPGRDIYLAGFSLGANVVTRLLAHLGPRAQEEFNMQGAAVNALPMDMTQTWQNVNQPGLSKLLYGDRLTQSIVDTTVKSYGTIEFPFALQEIQACRTIRDTEDLIMRAFGFRDAWDYYEKTKTAPILDQVHVPQLVIQALDDPFFQGAPNPPTSADMPLKIHYTEHGGHCGYILDGVASDNLQTETSWMPTELARFLEHVHTQRQRQKEEQTTLTSLEETLRDNKPE